MEKVKKVVIILAALAVIVLLLAASGYFIVVPYLEGYVASRIYEETGLNVSANITAPFNFVFTGKIKSLELKGQNIQVDGINFRSFEFKADPFRVNILKFAAGDFSSIKKLTGKGSAIITPKDLNEFFQQKNIDVAIEISDHELFLIKYLSGIGRVKISGRLEVDSSGVSFVPENIIEPRLLTLIMYPQLWINEGFTVNFGDFQKLFKLDRVFIDRSFIRVYFELKEGVISDYLQ